MLISNLFYLENSCMQFISYFRVAFQAGKFCSENDVSKGSGARAGKSTSARELVVVRSLSLFFLHSRNRASATTWQQRSVVLFRSRSVATRPTTPMRCPVIDAARFNHWSWAAAPAPRRARPPGENPERITTLLPNQKQNT